MNDTGVVNNLYLKLSREHEIVLNFFAPAAKLLKAKKFHELFELLKRTEKDLSQHIQRHFHFEEEVFFPAVLLENASIDSVRLVLKLQKEHGMIERDLRQVYQIIHSPIMLPEEKQREVLSLYRDLNRDVRRHARTEIQTLFPLLDQGERGRIQTFVSESFKRLETNTGLPVPITER